MLDGCGIFLSAVMLCGNGNNSKCVHPTGLLKTVAFAFHANSKRIIKKNVTIILILFFVFVYHFKQLLKGAFLCQTLTCRSSVTVARFVPARAGGKWGKRINYGSYDNC